MAKTTETTQPMVPLAHSPIRQRAPVSEHAGWEVSRASCDAPLRIADLTPLSKVLVRAAPTSAAAKVLRCAFGRSRREASGELIVGAGPDEWLLLAPASTEPQVVVDLLANHDDLVTVLDVTHGRVVFRLTGADSAKLLEKVCAIDLSDHATPDGAAFRSSVARLSCLVVRDDIDGVRSYLISSDRSSGQYLFDALAGAGTEFSIAPEGFPAKEI